MGELDEYCRGGGGWRGQYFRELLKALGWGRGYDTESGVSGKVRW